MIAFQALSDAYSIGYLVCGIAALLAAVVAVVVVGGRRHSESFVKDAVRADPH